jgi:hypothetical protein
MWQDDFLDEIRKVDREQAPHGLYGMREALADEFRKKNESWLPLPGRMLGASDPRTGIAKRLGWTARHGYHGTISFNPPGKRTVTLRVETHASTKVRHYGDGYVLDKVHGKKPAENPDLLESTVPQIRKEARSAVDTPGLLFMAHIHTPRGFAQLLGKTREATFLERYGLSFHSRTWEDIHGRGFHSGLFLWVAEPEQ